MSDVVKYQPVEFVEKFAGSFTAALPSHVDPGQWLAVAVDAVRRDPKIEQAAGNDLRRFAAALRQAARRGLEPGTEQFYLVPFSPRRGEPQVIEGIVGYQGLVELMYRAGAVSSVKAEVVRQADRFSFDPASDRPEHVVDWFATDRGDTIGGYAYATMEGGATSKVVVMNLSDITRIRKSSASSDSQFSPWAQHFDAMVLKTLIRQLAKWVPTSAEYRREVHRATLEAWRDTNTSTPGGFQVEPGPGEPLDPLTGELVSEVIDADPIE
ncbi:MAG: recombinase RecT [Propionibacteriaceae bacterium]|nr:recombinase RecT [Propionibacteriaceae bacterium]